ncbi:cytosine permease [Cupriavidus sp. CV2]|uniref:purine-cytosine permease family protein n=1 Tax=Cupriavidus ulmosensis TaxID=3065913 RepID=UPI00296AB004|nr:cytosine permease [Cupriavidus sp. CV2]MDW3688402.1 cytosine permease [Cupriavidus sp. CV2]
MTHPTEQHGLDEEFEHKPVPLSHRHRLSSVAAVWFGFPMIITNAVFGGIIAYNLGFSRALLAILMGNAILLAYVGTLSFIAGSTGRNFGLQAERTFGRKGYAITSGFLASVVVGWFAFQTGLTGTTVHASFGWNETATIIGATLLYTGVTFIGIRALSIVGMIAAPLYVVLGLVALYLIGSEHSLAAVFHYDGLGIGSMMSFGGAVTLVVATFADSGTMTADFTRWSKDGKSAVYATLTAFPFANMTAQLFGIVIVCAGAAAAPATQGGDFMSVLTSHGGLLSAIALVFVFVNLGSVCTHCLYNGAVGWGRIAGKKMRTMTVLLGLLGGLLAVAGVWSLFLNWLNLLGVLVPPIGAVIIVDQILVRHYSYDDDVPNFRGSAFAAWALGALAALFVHGMAPWFSEAVAGMLVGAVAHYVLSQGAMREVRQRNGLL